MPICKNCNREFPNRITINEQTHNLAGRKFCPKCSPIGGRNTRTYIIEVEEGKSFCARCKDIKSIKEFYIRKENGKPFSYCRKCQKEIKDLKLQEKLNRIIEERSGACCDCGIMLPPPIYEFYKDGKTYHISKAKNMSLQKIKEELKDYFMLCKNCCALRKWELGGC